jgi:hypothetical protein
LDITEPYESLPLIFAWTLITVDNIYREKVRTELTRWAYYNIKGFTEIINLLFGKYDPQLDEDLASIILGLASLINKPTEEIKSLASWISSNIFDESKISIIKNVIVRHGCRCFLEKTFLLGLTDETTIKSARPPYSVPFEYLPLDFEEGSYSREGRYPIVHDLDWYVIEQSYDHLLETSNPTHDGDVDTPTSRFLKKVSDKVGRDMGPKGFAVAAAISYIRGLGDHREDGNHFTEATHGSKSKVSTFEEKYTWLAVHYIRGYLADYLPFTEDYNESYVEVQDYSKLVSISNPADSIEHDFFPRVSPNWIIPTEIAPILNFSEESLAADIKTWVSTKRVWDFQKWFQLPSELTKGIIETDTSEWLILNNYTSIGEPNGIGEVVIDSAALIISENEFADFLIQFEKNKYWQEHYLSPRNLDASPNVASYVSPIDVIWMKWLDETYGVVELGDYTLYKTAAQIMHNINGKEKYAIIPSQKIRDLLDITSGNGQIFLDRSGKTIGFVNELGENYYDQQKMLLIEKDALKNKLKSQGLKLIWIFFEFNTTALAAKDKRDANDHYVHSQNCRLWIVWEENGEFKSFQFWEADYRN